MYKTKIIGLADSCGPEDVCVMRTYAEAVRRGGHLPVVLPATSDPEEVRHQLQLADVLLLPGGGDIAATRFGATPTPYDGTPNEMRDAYELLLMEVATEMRKPVFGICRGMQLINVFFGGTLWQDLPSQWGLQDGSCALDKQWGMQGRNCALDKQWGMQDGNCALDKQWGMQGRNCPPAKQWGLQDGSCELDKQCMRPLVEHSRPDKKWEPVHSICIDPQSKLAEILQVTATEVNSTHHQAVRRLGQGLKAVAWGQDGVVEAIESELYPIWAVQFHPERLAWGEDRRFTRIFQSL